MFYNKPYHVGKILSQWKCQISDQADWENEPKMQRYPHIHGSIELILW